MWEELGISAGTGIIVLIALYFVIKWGVKNGIRDYFEEAKETKILKKLYEDYKEKKEKHIEQEEGEEYDT